MPNDGDFDYASAPFDFGEEPSVCLWRHMEYVRADADADARCTLTPIRWLPPTRWP